MDNIAIYQQLNTNSDKYLQLLWTKILCYGECITHADNVELLLRKYVLEFQTLKEDTRLGTKTIAA